MRLNLWLAQAETERKLAAALRVAVIAFVCWALAAAYGLWSTRSALAASQAVVVSQSKQASEAAREIPRKRAEAAKADRVKIAVPESAASADLTDELSRIATVAGAKIVGVQVGNSGQETGATPSSPNPANAGPSSTTAAPAPTGDGWDQETFECNIAGEYAALTRFLSVLAASRHVLDITSVEVTQDGAKLPSGTKPTTDAPRLGMKLNGIVYELPEKS